MSRVPVILALLCSACAANLPSKSKPPLPVVQLPEAAPDPEPDLTSPRYVLRGGTVMTATGTIHSPGYLILEAGQIVDVGPGEPFSTEGTLIDATGKVITPGIIDTHSHMGVYPLPHAEAHSDGNEMTSPVTAQVWAERSFWPQDPALPRALAGGVTTIQVLPGSANLIGGRSFVAKLRPRVSARTMRFPGAPQGLKMACGENPKRVYGQKGQAPMTRMGNHAGYRAAFLEARDYRRRWQKYERDLAAWREKEGDTPKTDPPEPPSINQAMETLSKVLAGEILVHVHCYRADEMHAMLDLATEMGFKIRSFHHALEAYKLAGRLAEANVATSTWADWWGFKLEAFDGIRQNAAMLAAKGARAIIHSDSPTDIRILNQEAAKARAAGRKLGIDHDDDEVLRWITANPAWALGIDDRVGTLEQGKMADVVVWSGDPFSVYTRADRVFVDGYSVYERSAGLRPSDFEVGQPWLAAEEASP